MVSGEKHENRRVEIAHEKKERKNPNNFQTIEKLRGNIIDGFSTHESC